LISVDQLVNKYPLDLEPDSTSNFTTTNSPEVPVRKASSKKMSTKVYIAVLLYLVLMHYVAEFLQAE